MGHHHSHHSPESHSHEHPKNERNLLASMILNFIITASQITGGFISGSLALLSDALHNLSDGFASLISYIALKLAKKESTLQKTFGYKRAEIIAALFNTSVLVIISFFLFKESYERLIEPEKEIKSVLVIILGAIGLLSNGLAAFLLSRGAKENLNIRSAYLHLVSDAVTSFAVIIGGFLMYFFRIFWIDPVLTILIGLFVLKESYGILKETLNILMGNVPEEIDLLKIEASLRNLPEIDTLHHVHVWKLNERETHFSGHIDLNKNLCISDIDPIRLRIEEILKNRFHISHITLQIEYNSCADKELVKK